MEWEASRGENNGHSDTLLSYSACHLAPPRGQLGGLMRLARSLTRLAGTLPYSLAVGAVGVAYLSPSGTAGRPEPMPYRSAASRILGAKTGASCPLPVSKQVKAVKDFAEMLPVFRHPRCMNCHGGLDPMSDRHPGKDQLDPELTLLSNREKYLEQCQDCHDGLPGWMRPPTEALFFVGKDDEALCLQMKQFEKTGESFVEHIRNDHGDIQFIAAGFAGDRALGAQGLKDNGLVADPPPGTQADLTAKAQKWVDDLEGNYAKSPECGCVVPKIKLEIHHTTESNTPNGLPSKVASEVKFEVNLLPMGEDKPGGYKGDVSLVRAVVMTVPSNCTAKESINEHWTFYAIFPPDSDSMQVWRTQITDEPVGAIKCGVRPSGGWGGRRLSGKTDTVTTEESIDAGMLGSGEPFMMPSDSGSTKEFTEGEGGEDGDLETLSITVLAVPSSK
jgi:hypothetical protein